ncbi:MAG: hypothetical protein ACRDGT_04080 [Candidatus Limnocylindria bacterium]
MSGRSIFMVAASLVLAFALYAVVLQPAVARGGWSELFLVGLAFVLVIGAERWMRTR